MRVMVSGSFDDIRSRHVRLLEEAAKLGSCHVVLWSDALVTRLTGHPPKFSQPERLYFLEAIRFVDGVTVVEDLATADALPELEADMWVVPEDEDTPGRRRAAEERGLVYHVLTEGELAGFPVPEEARWLQPSSRPKVIVTGCYDWLHTGHIRFFEEASTFGDLYVAVGNDRNVRHLKGAGHPFFHQEERRYMVQAIRYVTQAVLTKGMGWMDAAPNIEEIRPDIYIVNEDGDRPEKRAFCAERGLQYVVLHRAPRPGLPRRSSTELRGF